jgi:hypothetical protein
MLPDAVTARETGNASRTTMNEGIVGALRRNDTAAGIQADASPYVEKIKQLVPACAHACELKMAYMWERRQNCTSSSASGASDAHSAVFSCTCIRTLSSQEY